MFDPFNLPETYPDVHGKKKKEFIGEGCSRPQKKKKTNDVLLNEDEVPLSRCQKDMLLKGTSRVVQHSSRAPDTTSGKLPGDRTPFVFDYVVSERILLIHPPPTSQPIYLFFHQISEPILLPPPPKAPILEPTTETPQVSNTL